MLEESAHANWDAVIIGGGAAGLATAIFAGRAAEREPADRRPRIVILDGAPKLGAKILVSGGGRCNVTNESVRADDFCGGSRNSIKRVLARLPVDKTIGFFREIGVELKLEQWGKLFPATDSARTVLAALLAEAERVGTVIRTRQRVTAIERDGESFHVLTNGDSFRARFVVLATGGKSLPKTGSDGLGYELARSFGHAVLPTTPALSPMTLSGDRHVALSGIAQEVELLLRTTDGKPVRIAGPMLWTHFGISGPAAHDLSRHWHAAELRGQRPAVFLNLLPGFSAETAGERLVEAATIRPRAGIRTVLAEWIPARVAEAVLAEARADGATTMAHLSRSDRRSIAAAMTALPLPVTGSRGYKFAEVTAGGVPLSEIDVRTMQSRFCPGLYFVGEILDVDGRLGGFNFQWAWSSGYVAGEAIAAASVTDAPCG